MKPIAGYNLPKEILGICGLAVERVRDLTLHYMTPEMGVSRLASGRV